MTARLLVVALLCAAVFIALGVWIAHHTIPRLDVESVAWRGTGLPLAIVFTNSGYGIALTCIAIASIGAALALRFPVKLPLAIVVSQILSQAVVNAIKHVFGRERPDAWLYRHELGFSYPSGHATTAIVFYGAWLFVVWCSPLPLGWRLVGVAILGLWILGIGWSRIALGAHYPTDVIGGYVFGIGWLCAVTALAASRDAGLAARLG